MFAEIDHQITLDLGGRHSRRLYEAVREDDPLVKNAAERLRRACASGSHVLLTTGFPIVPPGNPETDGPLGTVVLARALAQFGATPVLVVEPMVRDPITALLDELGCDFLVETVGPAASAASLLDRYDPTALVAIEKPGRCADGSYRNMAGADIVEHVGSVDALFEQARAQGIPTVAVGDGGNELGMGVVQSTVEAEIPHGETIAAVTPVDTLVVAGVSNWGAYGIVAALSVLAGENLMHTGELERRLLATALEAGCVDGVSGNSEMCVDGIGSGIHESVVDILSESCAATLAAD